jgi:tetratricopeptide (TPR) repeat protein
LLSYGKSTGSARIAYWQAGLRIAADHPLLGTGPGTFGAIYPSYKTPTSEDPRLAHNNFLEALSDSGVLGFVAYTALWSWPLVIAVRRLRESSDPILAGLTFSIVAWIAHGLVDFDQYIPSLAMLAFLLLGMLEARLHRPSRFLRFGLQTRIAVTVVALALCILPARRLAGQRCYGESLALMRNPYAASSAIEDAIRFAPLDAQYYIRSGQLSAKLGRPAALSQFRRARRLEPTRASYAWEMSQYLRSIDGNSEAFFLMAEDAVRLAPMNPRYRKDLSNCYGEAGRSTESNLHWSAYVEIQTALGSIP